MSSVLKTALSKAASPGRLIPRSSAHPPSWTTVAAPRRSLSNAKPRADEQAQPLGLYYELLLDDPPPYGSIKPKADIPPASTTSTAPPPRPEKPKRGRDPDPEAATSSPPKPGIQQHAAGEGSGTRSSSTAVEEVKPDMSGAISMDDDGGGSDTNWAPAEESPKIAKDLWDDRLYQNVPVGIREFMKQEKRLKEKHRLEGTSGGGVAVVLSVDFPGAWG
ncbi:hypothetical protein MAPG_06306 [Magnaporthiopsis poae ATCC 64411]|uniref:Uncharacterized protein n=1 Tax=Magnaporthiopsis poae (strain ATCC 64411 / 73-15) TaxID=644358 RepID=A0A0C4E1P0_MAGP6|nr:hypothetical protein MAPG_06306 [Magnaporthiopsis poae ATCC 64411]